MTSLVRDTTMINPEMPFAMRDFAGRWQFVMDNLTCGTFLDSNGVARPIAVDNARRNKGKFIADFSFATKAEHPEFAEAFFVLREQACIVDIPTCSTPPYPLAQNYDSSNALCTTASTTLTFVPSLNPLTNTYEIPADRILCNSMPIFHAAITGTNTLAALVAQLNTLVGAMGVWAVSGTNITLTGTACQTVALGFTI